MSDFAKAGPHQYVRRYGTKGNYRYVYAHEEDHPHGKLQRNVHGKLLDVHNEGGAIQTDHMPDKDTVIEHVMASARHGMQHGQKGEALKVLAAVRDQAQATAKKIERHRAKTRDDDLYDHTLNAREIRDIADNLHGQLKRYKPARKSEEIGMDLVKGGGEGSRGGHIVGHTAGGKPIYGKKGVSFSDHHAGMSHGEHREHADREHARYQALDAKARATRRQGGSKALAVSRALHSKAAVHSQLSNAHDAMADHKSGKHTSIGGSLGIEDTPRNFDHKAHADRMAASATKTQADHEKHQALADAPDPFDEAMKRFAKKSLIDPLDIATGRMSTRLIKAEPAPEPTIIEEPSMIDLSKDALRKARMMEEGQLGRTADGTIVVMRGGQLVVKAQPQGDDLVKGGGPYIGKRGGKWADPQHKIPWNDKKHSGKPAPTAKDHDEHAADNLQLVADNSGPLHGRAAFSGASKERMSAHQIHSQKQSIQANLVRKIAAGKYDHAQATKLWGYLADSADKHNAAHFGGGRASPATRAAAAKKMADQFHDEVHGGDHDDHEALTGVHGKRAKAGGGLSKIAQGHGKTRRETVSEHGTVKVEKVTRPKKGTTHYQVVHSGGVEMKDHADLASAQAHAEEMKPKVAAFEAAGARERAAAKKSERDPLDLVKGGIAPAGTVLTQGAITYVQARHQDPDIRSRRTGLDPVRKSAPEPIDVDPIDLVHGFARVNGQLVRPDHGLRFAPEASEE